MGGVVSPADYQAYRNAGADSVIDQTIPRSVRAAETSTTGKSIFQYDPKGKVAEAYHSIAKGVLADAEKRIKRQSEQLR